MKHLRHDRPWHRCSKGGIIHVMLSAEIITITMAIEGLTFDNA